MTKVGILVHCRNLTTIDWENMVFGRPEHDQLGDLAMLVRVILSLSSTESLDCILIGRGPSEKDGLDEGEYTKKFMIDNFDKLIEFPSLRPHIEALSLAQLARLRQSIEGIKVTAPIKNTRTEIAEAASIFNGYGIEKVIQSLLPVTRRVA